MQKNSLKFQALKVSFVFIALSVFISACTREEDGDLTPSGIPVLKNDITNAITLTDTLDGVDYIVEGCITVNGALMTVAPNVTIQFKSGACITFADGGALRAQGTSTQKITFEGQQSTKGFWKGLYFENSNSANNILEHVVISDAGGNTTTFRNAAICLGTTPTTGETASRIRLSNVRIDNSLGYGLYVSRYGILDQIDNCTITGCDKAPVQLMAANCDVLDNDNTFTGNGENYIEINGTLGQNKKTLSNMAIGKLPLPYAVFGFIEVEHDVTIAPGIEFIMMPNSKIYVGDAGYLNATGTSASRIVFTGNEHTKGFWKGFVAEYNGRMTLGYCDIADAGTGNNGMSVPFASVSASGLGNTILNMTNCNLSNGLNYGIAIGGASVTYNADIQAVNTFTDIDSGNFIIY